MRKIETKSANFKGNFWNHNLMVTVTENFVIDSDLGSISSSFYVQLLCSLAPVKYKPKM